MTKAQSRKRILLIDDDPITNMINSKLITMNFDFMVIVYTNALEALDQFKRWLSSSDQLPDFILLDINMPVMNGWEFLTEFQKFPAVLLEKCSVFIVTSAIDSDEIKKSKIYNSVRGFISKPLTVDRLKMLTKNDGNFSGWE